MESKLDPESEGLSTRPSSTSINKNDVNKKYKRFPISSILNNDSLDMDDLENCQMTVEEASHLLRDYEKQAFKSIITALRCQGPLTPYKECLIEHIKYALFIRDHDYIETMQELVSNPILTKIANTLNPSYSCEAQWQALCFPSHSVVNPVIRNIRDPGLRSSQRSKLFTKIGCHNVAVKDLDIATAKLCRLKKSLYIPQTLRRQLYDSELAYGRVDLDGELTEEELRKEYALYEKERNKTMRELIIEEDALIASGRTRSRKKKKNIEAPFSKHTLQAQSRSVKNCIDGMTIPAMFDEEQLPTEEEQEKAENEMFKLIEESNKITVVEPEYDSPRTSSASPVKIKRPRKSKENKHLMDVEPSTSNENYKERKDERRSMDEELVLVKTAQAMIEDMESTPHENGVSNGNKMISPTPKKRGRKMKEKDNEEEGYSCARVRPFDFGPIRGNDPNKPTRGNPDKRTIKRKERKPTVPVISNGVPYIESLEGNVSTPQAALVPGNPPTIVIRPRTNSISSNQSVGETSPAKRMRYVSENGSNPTISSVVTQATVIPAMFSMAVRPGRLTTFRPPNVVFPRATSALTNGTTRFVQIPQSSGNPTRPYYGIPFVKPTSTPTIRFVEPETTKTTESVDKKLQKQEGEEPRIPISFATTETLGPEEPLPRRPASILSPDIVHPSTYIPQETSSTTSVSTVTTETSIQSSEAGNASTNENPIQSTVQDVEIREEIPTESFESSSIPVTDEHSDLVNEQETTEEIAEKSDLVNEQETNEEIAEKSDELISTKPSALPDNVANTDLSTQGPEGQFEYLSITQECE